MPIGWLLRLILVLMVVLALWRFITGIRQGLNPDGRRRVPDRGDTLVKDPVCGTFVPQSTALTSGQGDRLQYFCSERCRQAFRG